MRSAMASTMARTASTCGSIISCTAMKCGPVTFQWMCLSVSARSLSAFRRCWRIAAIVRPSSTLSDGTVYFGSSVRRTISLLLAVLGARRRRLAPTLPQPQGSRNRRWDGCGRPRPSPSGRAGSRLPGVGRGVVPPPAEHRLPQPPGRRPGEVADVEQHLGLDPDRAAGVDGLQPLRERRRRPLERAQGRGQVPGQPTRQAAAGAAQEAQAAGRVRGAEQHRPHPAAPGRLGAPAADQRRAGGVVHRLEPVAGPPAGLVGRRGALRHHALQALHVEHEVAHGDPVGEGGGARGVPDVHPLRQGRERRHPVPHRDHLAVEHGARRQVRQPRELGVRRRGVPAVAAEHPEAVSRGVGEDADTVPLHLEPPARTCGQAARDGDRGGEHGLHGSILPTGRGVVAGECSAPGRVVTMRAIWKGAVAFGLVNVPLHQVHKKDGGRIRYRKVCSIEDEPVEYSEIAKGYETDDGQLVVLTDEDLDRLPLATEREIEVIEFVPADQVDPILLAKTYYLEPDRTAAKPYALLREALTSTDRMAVVKVALRQRESMAVLRVRDDVICLQTLLWPDEVREADFPILDQDVTVRPQELAMASSLVESLAGDFDPSGFEDRYRAALEQVIEAKVSSGRTQAVPQAEEVGEGGQPAGEVVDLLAALQRSVEKARGGSASSGKDADAPAADDEKPAKKSTSTRSRATKADDEKPAEDKAADEKPARTRRKRAS